MDTLCLFRKDEVAGQRRGPVEASERQRAAAAVGVGYWFFA